MLRFLLRSLWRLLILLIGIGLVWGVVRIYPYAEARLPAFFVLLLAYAFFAYVGIPSLIRLLRIFIQPNHIPVYVTTGDGWPSDPVNIAIVAKNEAHFKKAMEKAGWYTADPATWRNSFHEALSIFFNRPYPNAPFSNLYLFGRPFDIGFQIPTNESLSARSRHHVRFWQLQTLPENDTKNAQHYMFWREKLQHLLGADRQVWIGAAIEDVHAVGIRWRNGQLTHRNSNSFNEERDFIIHTLESIGSVRHVAETEAGKSFKFRGQQSHNSFVIDGNIKVVELKH
jgi:hypothetical protein